MFFYIKLKSEREIQRGADGNCETERERVGKWSAGRTKGAGVKLEAPWLQM